jgi:hypothetical protein
VTTSFHQEGRIRTMRLVIEVSVRSRKVIRRVLGVSLLPVSMIYLLYFGIAPTVWYFHVSCCFVVLNKNNCITLHVFQIVIYLISWTTMNINITETAPMATPIVVPTESNKINIIQKQFLWPQL